MLRHLRIGGPVHPQHCLGREKAHDPGMSEEIGEIKDELKSYKKQIDELREDLKMVVKYSYTSTNSVIAIAVKAGIPPLIKPRLEMQEFRDKYQIRIG